MQSLTFTRPDDWHLHVRDGSALNTVVPHSARQFARAIIMPNLKPPITTTAMALAYRRSILEAVPEGDHFEPLMTLYLTESTTHGDVRTASENPHIHAFKLYPAGATTHSDAGVKRLERIFPILETMQRLDLPLLVHGEKIDSEIDLFDREKAFIDDELTSVIEHFPALRIVFEHATTRDAVQFVLESGPNIAATITPQHLVLNRNALFDGGIRPHHYCLPILKREAHRKALIAAATGESRKFFLGTDSAPHPQRLKESSCGCAGCYTAHAALELYAELFEKAGALDRLEGFSSFYGPDFYRLRRNSGTITLEKRPWQVPAHYPFADQMLIPLKAGEQLAWKCTSKSEAPPAS